MAKQNRRVRYAVIGAGRIAQAAVLPAFVNASENSELVAIISGEAEKRAELSRRYHVPFAGRYEELERVLSRGHVDAVYLATPTALHRPFAERAASAGVHVLCEMPMAVTVEDCQAMIRVAQEHGIKLMVAYRLHFEEANLRAVELIQRGEIGKAKVFSSIYAHQVRPGEIRPRHLDGGAVFDMGVYPINAARYLFRDEPIEVSAISPSLGDAHSAGLDEVFTIVLRFPRERVAQMTISLGTAATDSYQVIGTDGKLRVEPAFGHETGLTHHLTKGGRTTQTNFAKRDQFAPELVYFSRCVLENHEPEPSGEEGLADVRIIHAALESAQTGRSVTLPFFTRAQRPDLRQEIHKPPVKQPRPIEVSAPTLR